jgi:CheY-like chemotaxis protein
LTTDGEQCVEAYKQATIQSSNRSEEYLAEHPPFDLVLMDGRMPIMDGVQAAKQILQINKQQRIVFITAYMRTTIETSLKDFPRALEIISKPVDLDVLLDIVEGGNKTVVPPR